MGMDLISKSGEAFDLSATWWWFYRALAELHGWKPIGTGKPEHLADNVRWDGMYDSCDGQIVKKEDAEALGHALTKAIANPNLSEVIDQVLFDPQNQLGETADIMKAEFELEFTLQLIEFCNFGEFQID